MGKIPMSQYTVLVNGLGMAQPAADQDKPFYSRFIAYND